MEEKSNLSLHPPGIGSKDKDDKFGNLRAAGREERRATVQNMDSKRQSKFPEKRILKLKENGLWEFSEVINLNEYPYESEQANKAGFQTSAHTQLTLKPGTPKGVKPSMCFCKPPTKRKSNNENLNQRYGSRGFSSEIQPKDVSRVEGDDTVSQQDYSQFYLDILSKESARSSVIQYASCLSGNEQYENKEIDHNHCKQPNDNLILLDNKQIDSKQTDGQRNHEQLNGKQIHDAQTDRKKNCDKQITDKQNDGKQKDETQVDDGKVHDPMRQQNVSGDGQLEIKEQQNHARKHSSVCGICLQEFPSILSLEMHRKENGHYLCGECGESLKDEAVLKEHLDKKLCKKAVCIFCGLKFITRDELENHKAIVHHKCLECNKLYNSAEKLLAHNERHHGAPYMCLQCGQKFPTRALCKKHSMTRHKKAKYYCPECGRGFTRMNLLNRHATYTHSDERNFQCEICTKTFKRPDALKIHMITHSDNKPFHCEKCGKQFTQKICYTKHLPCKQRAIKTKSQNIALPTMVEDLDNISGEPKTLAEHLYSLSENNPDEKLENVSSASLSSEMKDNSDILDKLSENNLFEVFENVSSASFGKKESVGNPVNEEIYMGCRCPPACRCKKFSIGLKVQMEEPKGPTLDTSEEIASLSCCCDIGFMDIPISD